MPSHYLKKLMDRFTGRKPMSAKRTKRKKGPAGETMDVRLSEKSPVGKLQAKSRRTQDMLDQLD